MGRSIRVVLVLLLSLFYGFIMLISIACSVIRHGRKFCTVKRRDNPPQCLRDSQLGKHSYVQLKDVKLHFVVKGDQNKPMMLLIHGFPEFWFSWRYQLKEFSREYWVVAVDMRGYGDSDKPSGKHNYHLDLLVEDMKDVILLHGKQSAVVVAHDWGGVIGWVLAAKYPDLVSKLIILNAPHPSSYQEVLESSFKQFLMSWYIFFFQLPYLPELTLRGNDLAVFNNYFQKYGNMCCNDEELEAYKYTFNDSGAFTPPLDYYRANLEVKVKKEPLRISVPTLIVWGDKDFALSPLLATECAKYVDNISVRMIKEGSHWIQMDKPKDVNFHIWKFLNN